MSTAACTGMSAKFVFGEVQGSIALSERVTRKASEFCAAHYAAEAANDFCGEDVETFVPPPWAPKRADWLPVATLAELGFAEASPGETKEVEQMVLTLGVDKHTDIHGPILCLVLHNDGLTFRQGRVRHSPKAGDWFIFNDLLPHGVKEARGAAVFASINLPLTRVADSTKKQGRTQ